MSEQVAWTVAGVVVFFAVLARIVWQIRKDKNAPSTTYPTTGTGSVAKQDRLRNLDR